MNLEHGKEPKKNLPNLPKYTCTFNFYGRKKKAKQFIDKLFLKRERNKHLKWYGGTYHQELWKNLEKSIELKPSLPTLHMDC